MLPNPSDRPLLKPDELVGLIPRLGRSAVYEAIARGEIPSIRYGSRVFIPTAALRAQWGLDTVNDTAREKSEAEPASSAGRAAHARRKRVDTA